MSDSKKKAPKKAKQYFKVVDTKGGHHGVFYKLGINRDPHPIPLDRVGTCSAGAIYFVELPRLHSWASYGDSIAWVTPKSTVKQDEDAQKYKAHIIEITRLLPFKEAYKLLTGISLDAWVSDFGLKFTIQEILESSRWSLNEKLGWLLDYHPRHAAKFVIANAKNKKFMDSVKRVASDFEYKDILAFALAGLYDFVDDETLVDLVHDGHVEIVKKMFDKNPKEFVKRLGNILY